MLWSTSDLPPTILPDRMEFERWGGSISVGVITGLRTHLHLNRTRICTCLTFYRWSYIPAGFVHEITVHDDDRGVVYVDSCRVECGALKSLKLREKLEN
jgi:hypothetical protein